MNMKSALVVMLALLLVSCAPDPREQAEARAITSEANQRAADEAQARAIEAEKHEIEMQNKRAAQAKWQAFVNDAIAFGSIFFRASLMMVLLSLGVGGAWSILETTRAYSKYAQRRAIVLANQIRLDPSTHTFPLLTVEVGKNMIAVMNANDNSVTFVDTTKPADPDKVKALANVLFAGEVARNARMSHKPGDIVRIQQTQIIDSEAE